MAGPVDRLTDLLDAAAEWLGPDEMCPTCHQEKPRMVLKCTCGAELSVCVRCFDASAFMQLQWHNQDCMDAELFDKLSIGRV